jgi:sporulation protein YlmC with PRC-barrel domain
MCGRYVAQKAIEAMVAQLKALNAVDVAPRYNVAPTQPVLAIWEEAGRREVRFARWGLVPRWVKDPRQFSLLVNARAETLAEKPAFRDALKHGRCILPATGYYEWQLRADKKKQPYYITFANDEPMALAGLYTTWSGPQGEEVDTGAAETTEVDEPWDISEGYTAADTDNLATQLIGQPVYSSSGEDAENIGNVSDLVFSETGQIEAVIIGVGGFLGIGEKRVAADFRPCETPVPELFRVT